MPRLDAVLASTAKGRQMQTVTFARNLMTPSKTTSFSGSSCFTATKHPATTPSNPATSLYL